MLNFFTFLLMGLKAEDMFQTSTAENCWKSCRLNRVCTFWVFSKEHNTCTHHRFLSIFFIFKECKNVEIFVNLAQQFLGKLPEIKRNLFVVLLLIYFRRLTTVSLMNRSRKSFQKKMNKLIVVIYFIVIVHIFMK